MKKILTLLTLICSLSVFAQKSYYVDSAGNLYWQKSKPVYLFISDNAEGEDAKRLKSKTTPQYANPLYLDTEGVNYIRTRNAVDPETKQIIPNTEILFEVYADGISPISSHNFNSRPTYSNNGISFYKDNVKIHMSVRDQMSGVAELNYAINGSEFMAYTDSLSFEDAGKYVIYYYSEDNVGNIEDVNEIKFSIDPTPPETTLNINGMTEDSVIATSSAIYIIANDSLSGVSKVFYKIDNGEYKQYSPKSKIPVENLSEGEHTFSYYAVDYVGNKEEENNYTLYLDRSPPLMVADILGDRFIVGDEVYFSGRTKLKLTAVDNKVGVKEIMYAIDEEEFRPYEKPFYLPSVSGEHTISYYSVDNLDNASYDQKKSRYIGQGGYEKFKHNVSKVYVDMTGPEVEYSILDFFFEREDTLFIGPSSRISLRGSDSESGLKEIRYSINDELGEIPYSEPFNFDLHGFTTLNIYGYDNVNNRNLGEFKFYCDTEKPEIFVKFSTGSTETRKDLKVYPLNTGVFLSATDKISGVSSLTYKLNKDEERNYTGLIKIPEKGKHKLVITAYDVLNNKNETEVEFFVK